MKAMLEDLARSGLTKKDAQLMRVNHVTESDVSGFTKKRYRQAGYSIPYLDEKQKYGGYFRLRFYEPVETEEGRQLRYWQPSRTGPRAYFPPHIDWAQVRSDPTVDIIITEGEKKAAAGCKFLKKPVIGLGGVWSWGSKREQVPVIPELLPYLKNRRVLICFDHDPIPKPDVTGALHTMARALRRSGAEPWLLPLPMLKEGEKAGLDDVLVAKGAEFVLEIEPEKFADTAALSALNEEIAYITKDNAVYHFATHGLYQQTQRITGLMFADRQIVVYDSKGQPVEKNLAAEWLKWPGRRRHPALSYAPGKEKVLPNGEYNVWPGWPIKPKRGDVTLFIGLIDALLIGASKEQRKWFMQWLAYPIQHPGTKLYTAVLLYSNHQGVGKSLLGQTLGKIYGENFSEINAEALHAPFNDWARHKQFILGDEVTGRERKEDAEHLKNLMTQAFVRINVKYQAAYALPDCINYLLTTNNPDAISLDLHDRRFFVWEVPEKRLDEKFFQKYNTWFSTEVGIAAVFEYLLRVDLAGFNPKAHAPATRAKQDMQELSGAPIDYVLKEFLEAPERALGVVGATRDLYTASEISELIDAKGKYHHVVMAKALKRLSVPKLTATRARRGTVYLYPIRQKDKWVKADHDARRAHYDGEDKK